MRESRRKWLWVVLVGLLVIAAVRLGFALYQSREAQKAAAAIAARATELRFRHSSRVLAFLNRTDAPLPQFDGRFPCVSATVAESEVHSELGKCSMPVMRSGPLDRFEADLRYGHFILRQFDLVETLRDLDRTLRYSHVLSVTATLPQTRLLFGSQPSRVLPRRSHRC